VDSIEVKPEDIREVETVIRKYVWVCPVCGKTISSYTKAMTLKYARLHAAKHSEKGG
jgi:hypothetical protein